MWDRDTLWTGTYLDNTCSGTIVDNFLMMPHDIEIMLYNSLKCSAILILSSMKIHKKLGWFYSSNWSVSNKYSTFSELTLIRYDHICTLIWNIKRESAVTQPRVC